MPIDLSGRRVFIASPGGIEDDRAICRSTMTHVNAEIVLGGGTACFIPVGWEEDIPGGVGRPQGRINQFLREADFTVVLLHDRMGSPASKKPPFLTGVEEELVESISALADPALPMREVLLLFRTVDTSEIRDPDDDLRAVLDFKNRIEATKLLYYQGYETLGDLDRKLRRALSIWSKPLESKQPRAYDELLEAISASDRPGMPTPPQLEPDGLVDWANNRAAEGMTTQAETAFALAAKGGAPRHLAEFARFARRTGQFERAVELNNQILAAPSLMTSDDAEAVSIRARALANIGLIARKEGRFAESEQVLREAVATAESANPPPVGALAYCHDMLGHTLARNGDVDQARYEFTRAAVLRKHAGDHVGEAKSLINLARAGMRAGGTATIEADLERAIANLDGHADEEPSLANALAALAEWLETEDPVRSGDLYRSALAINSRLKNADGMSVVEVGLARLALAVGDTTEARKHLSRAVKLTSRGTNREGAFAVMLIQGRVERQDGHGDRAQQFFEEAVDEAQQMMDHGREAVALSELGSVVGFDAVRKKGREAAVLSGQQRLVALFDAEAG